MSSRTRREREGHSKRDGRERRRHTETGNRHERHSESIPRSYNDGTDSFFSPADGDLAGTMARLEVDPNSRGKGKGKQEEPAWSGWTWSDQRSCYYRARLKQSGEYEYEFSEAYTTAPGSVSGSQEASVSPTPQHSQSYSSEAQEEPPTRHPAESHHTLQTGTYPLGDSSHDDREYDSTGRSSVYNAEDNPSAGGPSEYYPPGHPGYPPASSSYLSASSSYPPTSSDTSSTYPPSGYTSPQHYQSGSTAASTAYSGSYDSGYPMTGRSMGSYSMSYGLGSQWPDDQFPPVFVPPPDCDCDPKRPGEKLCGVIIWPEQPTPDDGKVTDDPYQSSRPTATEKLVVRVRNHQSLNLLIS
ncbi:uncharacterized protein K444DRAFT_388096 [Hyaloscypha bicolor E]|uniref:Uncharacterized protein n=1 Tax=Hyaloscypha bicolor E TaxID=1095630 RepID=A0A2J6TCK5_9HELO|nr:uncharacterized protein K444DRAFT_388096 [Hyaloscypha bicolor E]PMD60733.1 hypothetical protein K444DRAFT_388096 [Hyaloscypha bicolor E]